jgi:hypothetical protein
MGLLKRSDDARDAPQIDHAKREHWPKAEIERDRAERARGHHGLVGSPPRSHGEWLARTVAPIIRSTAPAPTSAAADGH